MNKLKIKFTPEETKNLRKAKIKLNQLENYTLNEIVSALNTDEERIAEIRAGFFGYIGGESYPKSLGMSLNEIAEVDKPVRGLNALLGSFDKMTRFTYGLNKFERILGGSAMIDGNISRMMELAGTEKNNGLGKLLSTNALGFLHEANKTNFDRIIGKSPIFDSNISRMIDSSGLFKAVEIDRLRATTGLGLLNELTKNHRLYETTAGMSSMLKMLPSTAELSLGSRLAGAMPQSLLRESEFKRLGISSLISEMTARSVFERAHLSGIGNAFSQASSFSRLAESNLGSFSWDKLGSRMELSAGEIARTQKKFLGLSAGYSDVLKVLNTKPNWIYEAPEVAKMPAVDFYASSRLLKIVTTDDSETSEIQKTDITVDEENGDAIKRFLPELDPDLINLWLGAIYALNSDNPDKIRHFITSLRELFGHVMRIMAPDQQMATWDTERMHYDDKGRPTRKGRFLYICRNIEASKKEFTKLMVAEVDSTIMLIDLFQGGTHAIKSKFGPNELKLIQIKAETTLRYFLNIEFEINRIL